MYIHYYYIQKWKLWDISFCFVKNVMRNHWKKKKKHNFVKIKWLYIEKYYMIKCNKNSYQIFIGTTLYHWMLISRKTYIWHWQHDYDIICFKILITLNSSREVFAKGLTIFHIYIYIYICVCVCLKLRFCWSNMGFLHRVVWQQLIWLYLVLCWFFFFAESTVAKI